MADNVALGDLLSGAAGRPVNRPALEAAVMQGQAMAGLRTAQTENSLLQAQRLREEQDASDQLENTLMGAKDPNGNNLFTPSQAKFTATQMKFLHGGSKEALEGWIAGQKAQATATLGDPNQLGSATQTAAQQALEGKVATPFEVKPESGVLPGAFTPTVLQTPGGAADTAQKTADARLKNVQADVGGFNPNTGFGGMLSRLPQDQQDALNQAMEEHRINPKDLNSRNIDIYGHMAVTRPGFNFNRAIADATLSRNPTFQQRAMIVEGLPGLISNVTSLGKKLNYADLKIVGEAQKWVQGQTNDPMLTEYMAARNDTLFKIANVMRGIGMSDKAFAAEDEIAHPSMSAAALDGWLKGQMSAIKPLIEQQHRAAHIGETPAPSDGGSGGGSGGGADEAPPASLLQEGHITTFDNGQQWALRNGAPVRVK